MKQIAEKSKYVTSERRNLETRVWLQILSLESKIFSALNGALSAELGLSVAKFEALAQLDRYPDGLSLGHLSQNLKVSGGNVSGLVQRLLADDLITKEMSSQDRRSFIAKLSQKGKLLFEKARVVHDLKLAECFDAVPTADLTADLASLKILSGRTRGASHE